MFHIISITASWQKNVQVWDVIWLNLQLVTRSCQQLTKCCCMDECQGPCKCFCNTLRCTQLCSWKWIEWSKQSVCVRGSWFWTILYIYDMSIGNFAAFFLIIFSSYNNSILSVCCFNDVFNSFNPKLFDLISM